MSSHGPRRPVGAFVTLLVLAAVHGTVAAESAHAQDTFNWRGHLAPGQTIEVKGINGPVRAELADGDAVEVLATKQARRSDPRSVEFEVVEHAAGVTICALYPSGRVGRPNRCEPGTEGRMNTRNNDVQVEFVVRVPRDVHFSGRTVNGDVRAEALHGNVSAHTVNGAIRVSTAGLARASTVNGAITARLGRADWVGTLAFGTVNGAITLDLPASLEAEVDARTVSGDITSDFPLLVQSRLARNRLSGTIGDGGRVLELATVNGRIRLRKADD